MRNDQVVVQTFKCGHIRPAWDVAATQTPLHGSKLLLLTKRTPRPCAICNSRSQSFVYPLTWSQIEADLGAKLNRLESVWVAAEYPLVVLRGTRPNKKGTKLNAVLLLKGCIQRAWFLMFLADLHKLAVTTKRWKRLEYKRAEVIELIDRVRSLALETSDARIWGAANFPSMLHVVRFLWSYHHSSVLVVKDFKSLTGLCAGWKPEDGTEAESVSLP